METTKTFNAPEVKLHFLDYWRIIRIRKTVILAVFLLVALTTTLVTFILPETFSSTVRIAVEKDAPDIANFGGDRLPTVFDPYWIQTQFEKIRSKLILHQVITNLNLKRKWAEKFKEEGELPNDVTYNILKRSIDVQQARNTTLIEISAFSEDKREAADIANEVAKVYRDSRLSKYADLSRHGIETLQMEYEKQHLLVKEKQAEVDMMRTNLGINELEMGQSGTGATTEPEQLRKLQAQRIEAKADYTRMVTLYSRLTNLTRVEFKKAISTASPDQLLADLIGSLSLTEQKLADLSETHGPDHPDVRRTRKICDTINRQVDERLDGILDGLGARTEAQKASLTQLEQDVDKFALYDQEIAVKRAPYFQLKRDLENYKFIRDRLLARIIQEKVDAALPRQNIVEIIDQAEPGLRAVKPNKFVNIALGIIVGLAVGIGLAFFIEYLDTSVKTIDDVERALQAPVLGVIPQNVGHLIFEGPDSPHAEAYRVLRTNILFSLKDPKLNTITVVSGGAGEGKSTTIFNLATIFAQNGSRVLIVDSDLRRPSLHKILKISNAIGLTNYLLKQNSLEEVIQTSPLATLDFLPSGKLPSSSMGVLSSAQMKELIRELKRRYDYVFFDSPPIMGVSDASILSSEVDSVLQVIQYRRYPQPMTIRAKQMIEKVGGNLLGIVLNNINMASE